MDAELKPSFELQEWNEKLNLVIWDCNLLFNNVKLLQCLKYGLVAVNVLGTDRHELNSFCKAAGWRPVEQLKIIYDTPRSEGEP